MKLPVPVIPPAASVLMLSALVVAVRSMISVASFVTAPAPKVPVVPPLPTLSVPALIVVVPAYPLSAVRIVVPVPLWLRLPLPLMLPVTFKVPAPLDTSELVPELMLPDCVRVAPAATVNVSVPPR